MRQQAAHSPAERATEPKQGRSTCLTLPPLNKSASSPSLQSGHDFGPTAKPTNNQLSPEVICSKKWTTEQRRLLHQRRERDWLQKKAKHRYIDFSDGERGALRRYFDALSEGQPRLQLDKLENMLISLGLAETREEVREAVDTVNGDGSRELDFEEYLELVRTRADSDLFLVFKAMKGTLGDPDLNFQTVISGYRRSLILDATGARGVTTEQRDLGYKILNNFALLQRNRHADATRISEEEREMPATATETILPFDNSGRVWSGGPLGIMWRGVCHEEKLVNSRPSSVEGRSPSRRTLQRPMSPQEVIEGIVKEKTSWRAKSRIGTVVVRAPGLSASKDQSFVE